MWIQANSINSSDKPYNRVRKENIRLICALSKFPITTEIMLEEDSNCGELRCGHDRERVFETAYIRKYQEVLENTSYCK